MIFPRITFIDRSTGRHFRDIFIKIFAILYYTQGGTLGEWENSPNSEKVNLVQGWNGKVVIEGKKT